MNEDLISLVNRLQDTFNAIGGETVDLPQIVVVGSQSSGKSSVLETIVGRDFLPRGSGIVTRRPLVLQLIHVPSEATSSPSNKANLSRSDTFRSQALKAHNPFESSPTQAPAEWGEFLHSDKLYTDFGEIRREIEAETFRVAGQNKGISKLPINLKIFSPNVVNLTLVDLPGLTKIPVGDQPSDIEKQIRNLVLDFISRPNCVILAVSPANVDLANSESLKLSRSVDPTGRRTIGVLSKLDLMDAGTNALDILNGRLYPLKLGFIGVVNRSQADINADLPLSDAARKETDFFKNHPSYRAIAHKCGTQYLAKSLNQVLMGHIREKLPDMKARLNTLMGQTQQELKAFGDMTFLGESNRGSLILKLMTQFGRDFISSIDGTSINISTKELSGGARIYYVFNEIYGHALDTINPTENLTAQDIRTAIRNSTGPRPSLFVPEVAFELLVKQPIQTLLQPSLRCVELVYEELMKICHNCTGTELKRFPRLHAQLIEVVSELLQERLSPTSEYVTSLIEIQNAYINTNHPDFVSGSAAFAKEATKVKKSGIESLKQSPTISNESASEDDQERANGQVSSPLPISGLPPREAKSAVSKDRAARKSLKAGSFSLNLQRSSSDVGENSQAAPAAAAPSDPNNARETFLNYFFGNAVPDTVDAHPQLHASSQIITKRNDRRISSSMRDMSENSRSVNNANISGIQGEGTAAAFDMKSLGRHLEPASEDPEFAVSAREEMETTLIRSLIASYFAIVRRTIQDSTPKAIMHLLVNFTKDSIQDRLVASLYRPELFADLLHEDEELATERSRLKAALTAYREAFQICSEVTMNASPI